MSETIEFSFSIIILLSALFFSLHNMVLVGNYVYRSIDESCKSIIVSGVEINLINSRMPLNESLHEFRLQYDFEGLNCKFSIILLEYNVYGGEYLPELSHPIFIEFNGRVYFVGVPGV
ncbi:MAG: hypothetical protein MRT15_02090 [archaeon YNP-LCB-003-016]|uniref:hypothetical protein n=1 Tax=Candidatus Culexarchaeum yellowstonense TaxID=2928963 RepID=UPI0026EF9D82|nr:hypothetical protein [Candidatus Culexarchaeum yellowstonense]MCR6691160.1 hypothetical protein [Candidatus Culexarchaeum yellowstonense]